MNMEKKERLQKAFETLRFMGIIKTQVDIAERMQCNKSSVSQAMKGNMLYLTDSFLLRFNKAFDDIFNENWLVNGDGEMIVNHGSINQTINRGKNINSGTAQQVGDNNASPILEDVVKQQSEQIGKLIDDNAKRSEQIDKLISMLAEKL